MRGGSYLFSGELLQPLDHQELLGHRPLQLAVLALEVLRHYYFYWMDRELGLIYVRVPTYCPFRLQVYCNGHGWLARRLTREGIDFATADNAFVRIADFTRAQALADGLNPDLLHRHLNHYARLCCPVLDEFGQTYHWSIMQIEYSTDLLFKSEQVLAPLYAQLAREAVLSVKAEQVSTFLGKKITPQVAAEIGSRLSTRIEGTCIKHKLGSCSVKLYDKFARILRIETTTNDVSFFKHHRKVEHRGGHATREVAPLKKSIYSLIDLREILLACNQRYLEFLSSLDDHSPGQRLLDRVTHPKPDGERSCKGLNFFDRNDQALLRAVQRPEFNIHGLARADLLRLLPAMSPSSLSRQLRRLRVLGLLKRAANTYRLKPTVRPGAPLHHTCAPAEGRVLLDAVLPAKLPNRNSGGLGLPQERTIGSSVKRFFVCKLSVARLPSGLTDCLATNYRLGSRPLRIAQERRSGPRPG